MKKKWKWTIGIVALGMAVMLGACSGEKESSKNTDEQSLGKINLAYVEWDTEIASTHVVGQVLEDIGYEVTLTPLDNAIMWEAVSKGEADGMVAGWLPATHASQLEKYGDGLVHLGENLTGAKVGLVVPSYMDVDSIEDLTTEARATITGIEPGAGIMSATEAAIDSYPNLAKWELKSSSSGAMAVALDQAYNKNEEIIVTGWSPHWKFAKYDLKYLADPKGIYGGEETINTFVRKGLEQDAPEAYKVLDAFQWTSEDVEAVMLEIIDGKAPEQAAKDWIKANVDQVATWTEGIK